MLDNGPVRPRSCRVTVQRLAVAGNRTMNSGSSSRHRFRCKSTGPLFFVKGQPHERWRLPECWQLRKWERKLAAAVTLRPWLQLAPSLADLQSHITQ